MTVPSRLRRVVALTLLVVGPLTAVGLADVLLAPTEGELAEECSANAKQVYSPDPVAATVAAIRELANAGLDEVAAARLEALAETIESPPKATPTLAELAAGGRALAADCEPAARTWPEWVAQRTDVALGRTTGPLTDGPGGLRLGEGATKAVEAVAWLLPLLVALLFLRQVRMLFADREPGPVEVLPVSVATAAKGTSKDPPSTDPPVGPVLDPDSASNVLRIALGSAGLSPGSLTPGGMGTKEVDATTALSGLPGPEWLAALWNAIRSVLSPARGYLVQTSLVPTAAGAWSAAVQLQHKRTGKTLLSEQVEDRSCEDVLRRAAFRVHQRLHEEPEVRRRTAGQLIWTSEGARGLELYQEALVTFHGAQTHPDSYSRDGAKLRAALELAEQAVYLEPGNLPARVLLGDCHLRLAQRRQRNPNAQRILDALQRYLCAAGTNEEVGDELGEAWADYLRTPRRRQACRLVEAAKHLADGAQESEPGTSLVKAMVDYFGLKGQPPPDSESARVPASRNHRAERRLLEALEAYLDSDEPAIRDAGDKLILAWTKYLDAPGTPAPDRADHYVDALEAYLESVYLDPTLSETRLRLASVLTYAPDWAEVWRTQYCLVGEDAERPDASIDGPCGGGADADPAPGADRADRPGEADERRRRRAQARRVVALLEELHRRDRSTAASGRLPLDTTAALHRLAERQLSVALHRIRFTSVATRWLRLATRDSVRGAVWPASRRRRSVKDFILAIRTGLRASHQDQLWPSVDQLGRIRLRRFRRLADGDHIVRYDLAFAYYELEKAPRPWREKPHQAVVQLERAHQGPEHALSRADLAFVAGDPDWDPGCLRPMWRGMQGCPKPGDGTAEHVGSTEGRRTTGPAAAVALREEPAFELWWERLSRETRRTVASTATAGQAWAEVGTGADQMAALWAHRLDEVGPATPGGVEQLRLIRGWYESEVRVTRLLQASLAGPSQAAERRTFLDAVQALLEPGVPAPPPMRPPTREGTSQAFAAASAFVDGHDELLRDEVKQMTDRLVDGSGLSRAERYDQARARLRFWEALRRLALAPADTDPDDLVPPESGTN